VDDRELRSAARSATAKKLVVVDHAFCRRIKRWCGSDNHMILSDDPWTVDRYVKNVIFAQ
jgi:hypothetical protein